MAAQGGATCRDKMATAVNFNTAVSYVGNNLKLRWISIFGHCPKIITLVSLQCLISFSTLFRPPNELHISFQSHTHNHHT